jgi:hypothetical protein
MLTFEYLRTEPFARALVDRVRLGKPPELVCSAWFDDLTSLGGDGGVKKIAALRAEISRATNLEVYVNYYLDKRRRLLELPASRQAGLPFEHRGGHEQTPGQKLTPSGIVGVVGVSRVERVALEDVPGGACSGRLTVAEHELFAIFERFFRPPPRAVLMGWVGTQGRVPPPELFAVS